MEKGKAKPAAGDNYDNVNMEMSDESDNELFACKEEYQSFKQHFENKAKNKQSGFSEYGGDPVVSQGPGLSSIEYGSGPAKSFAAGGSSEYGSGAPPVGSTEYGGGSADYGSRAVAAGPSGGHMQGSHIGYGQYNRNAGGFHHNSYPRRSPTPPAPTPAKIEREPKLYKDNDKEGIKRSKSRLVLVL